MAFNSSIKPRVGFCKKCSDGKEKPLIKGLCHQHYWASVRLKSANKQAGSGKLKQRQPIKKISQKGKVKREEKKSLIELDKIFYMEVWNASPHRCYECNKKLSSPPSMAYFHHLLPKRNYPAFRHTPENIALLCWNCHQQVEIFIDKAPKTKLLTEMRKKNFFNHVRK